MKCDIYFIAVRFLSLTNTQGTMSAGSRLICVSFIYEENNTMQGR